MKTGFLALIAGICLIAGSTSKASADIVEFSLHGIYDSTVLRGAAVAADTPFSIWFDLPNPIASNPTTEGVIFAPGFFGYTYVFGEATREQGTDFGLTSVQFFSAVEGRMFILKSPALSFEILGEDVGSTLSIVPSHYIVSGIVSGPFGHCGSEPLNTCFSGTLDITTIPSVPGPIAGAGLPGAAASSAGDDGSADVPSYEGG